MIEKKQKSDTEPAEKPAPATEQTAEPTIDTPHENIPAEMRGAFMRARAHPNRLQAPICQTCVSTPNIYPNDTNTPTMPEFGDGDAIPLPPDFETNDTFTDDDNNGGFPVFQNIDIFGDNTTDNTQQNESEYENPVAKHLQETNRKYTVLDNDIILTDNAVIATHDDDDFWIMDEPMWFASGQTRESPITTLLATAAEHGVKPILYLGATNIMEFDKKRSEWENAGIQIITDISEI